MPLPPPPSSPRSTTTHRRLLIVACSAAAAAATVVFLLVLLVHLRRRRRSRATLPFSPPRTLRRYSRHALRRATGGFHASRLLGRGAASPVYLASFPDGSLAAVKTRPSPQELRVLGSIPASPHLVSLVGYSSDDPLLLVFEYMPHGSLQAALFGDAHEGRLLDWPRRVAVIRDVGRALAFLHGECQPQVVHGDLKPSNVLLDADFRAKLADFGLARFKTPETFADAAAGDDFLSQELGEADDLVAASLAGRREEVGSNPGGAWGKDWWWKQDESGELDARDYVAEWIGSQICPQRIPDWADDYRRNAGDHKNSPVATDENSVPVSPERNKNTDHNANGDGNGNDETGDKKEAKMREWWKEEYFEEMTKKGNSFDKRRGGGKPWLRSISTSNGNGDGNEELSALDISFRKGWKRGRRRGRSGGSDMHSAGGGGDFLSRELSSTTSMRGTVCYVAPECSGGGACENGELLDKSDVYSFGVLVLVILSGRRPLHILASPMKLEKANLVSWCRQLARTGNVLEIMDDRLEGCYDKDQAALCANLALLCLQRLPELRPNSADVVKILSGEMELPAAPAESSPSPRMRPFQRSSRRAPSDATE